MEVKGKHQVDVSLSGPETGTQTERVLVSATATVQIISYYNSPCIHLLWERKHQTQSFCPNSPGPTKLI